MVEIPSEADTIFVIKWTVYSCVIFCDPIMVQTSQSCLWGNLEHYIGTFQFVIY